MRKWFIALVFVFACNAAAIAQGCAVCTKTASSLDDESARGLNGGIVYLALLPLGLMGTVGFIWWKRNRAQL